VSGRIQQLRASTLLAGVIMTAAAASQTALDGAAAWAQAVRSSSIDAPTASRVERFVAGAEARVLTRNSDGQRALEIITIAAPQAAQSLAEAAGQSVDRLSTWLGPLPGNRVTIVDVPAQAHLAGSAYPGIAITSSRLLTTRREFAAERALTVAIARQYALASATAPQPDSWFAEGLAAYFATRAVHESFEGRYYLTLRYFGGYVPHSIRAIVMSPNPLDPRPRVARLAEVVEPADAPWRLAHGADLDRANKLTMALHTLERFVGWPAFQATLRAFVERTAGRTPALGDLTAVLSEQRGADKCFCSDQRSCDQRFRADQRRPIQFQHVFRLTVQLAREREERRHRNSVDGAGHQRLRDGRRFQSNRTEPAPLPQIILVRVASPGKNLQLA
jgi:hypothetical protein